MPPGTLGSSSLQGPGMPESLMQNQQSTRTSKMKIHAITIDTDNPQKLAEWWSTALGISIANDYGQIVQLATSPNLPPFQFQKIADVPTQRNRVHFDLKTEDLEGETQRLVKLGASILNKIELPQIRYTSLADPDGNIFDLIQE